MPKGKEKNSLKRQSKKDETEILKLSDKEFKITMSNMLGF